MAERKYVYRLIVDHWPTADGEPFIDQPWEWWDQIVKYFHNPVGDDPNPDWLPDISGHIEDPGDYWTPPQLYAPPFTRIIAEPGEDPEHDTGYAGYPPRPIIAVPVAPTRRFFQRSTPLKIAQQLREWGCRAHIERAQLSDWEAIDA
jgi:hypothetical protein